MDGKNEQDMESGWKSETRNVNGLSLHVVEAGPEDGPLLILLHGFPEFWWAWRHQITPLAEQGYHVVAPDMRGYNLSYAPKGINAYKLETLTADILALADSFGAERFHLAGHDWGGVIGWDLAADHPGRLERLVIVNGPHPDLWRNVMMTRPTQALRSSYAAFFQLPRIPEAVLGASGFRVMRAMMQGSARKGTFTAEDLDRYAEVWSRPGTLTAMLNYYRALRKRALPAEPRRIRTPTLILWGEKDVALEQHVARAALETCDGGRLDIIPGATHWVHHEEPKRVNAELIAFL
jgi:pimeloyl-ACP methyl ester carboxylesterase